MLTDFPQFIFLKVEQGVISLEVDGRGIKISWGELSQKEPSVRCLTWSPLLGHLWEVTSTSQDSLPHKIPESFFFYFLSSVSQFIKFIKVHTNLVSYIFTLLNEVNLNQLAKFSHLSLKINVHTSTFYLGFKLNEEEPWPAKVCWSFLIRVGSSDIFFHIFSFTLI